VTRLQLQFVFHCLLFSLTTDFSFFLSVNAVVFDSFRNVLSDFVVI
jgi:hypothetical protein